MAMDCESHWEFRNLINIHYRDNIFLELDLQSLFGLYVTWCAQLSSLAETPQLPPSPRIWAHIQEGCYWSAKRDDISL